MKRFLQSTAIIVATAAVWVTNAATPPRVESSAPAQTQTEAAAPANPSTRTSDPFASEVVAKGAGVSVTRGQLDEALIGIKASAAAQGRAISPEQLNMLERSILQRLIQVQLLNQKATEADKRAGRELAEQRLKEIEERAGSEEKLEQQLKSIGFNRAELTEKMAQEATAEAVLKREIEATVTEEEVKKAYEENSAEFEQPEMVRAAHILLATRDLKAPGAPELSEEQKAAKRKLAEDLLKRARAGEDFAALAREYSEDTGSKETGGEYTFARSDMVPEFEAAAFSLGTNQLSDIVTTQFGYHIIKVLEKSPAKIAKLTDEAVLMPPPKRYIIIKEHWIGRPEVMQAATNLSAIIRAQLERQEIEQQIPEYMQKLANESNIEILDESLKPMAARTLPGPGMDSPSVR